MNEFKVHWHYREDGMTPEVEEELVAEIMERFGDDVERGKSPFEKSLEEGIALSALTLVVHNPETLVAIYKLLKDRVSMERIRIQNADTGMPVFQVLANRSQNIGSAENVNIEQYEADEIILVDGASQDDLRAVQRALDGQEAIIERLDEIEEQLDEHKD